MFMCLLIIVNEKIVHKKAGIEPAQDRNLRSLKRC